MTRPLAALLALLAAAPARPDPAPAPPPDHPPRVLEAGQLLHIAGGELVTVPPEGGLYLSPPAFRYQLELRRFTELELQICQGQVESTPPGGWKPWAVGGAAGAVVGLVLGLTLARRVP